VGAERLDQFRQHGVDGEGFLHRGGIIRFRMKSLQDTYGPNVICFGCGPANPQGLQIKSFPEGDDACVAEFRPQKHQQAFPGVLNGGIIVRSWTATATGPPPGPDAALRGKVPPCTVTADFHVVLKRPTPSTRS